MNDKKREQRKKILQLLKKEAPYGLSIRQISERVFGDPEPDRNRKDMIRRHLVNEPLIESYGNTRGRNFRYVSTVLDSDFTLKEIADAWVSCDELYYRGSHGYSWWSSFQNCMMEKFPEIHQFLFWNGELLPKVTNYNWDLDISSLRKDFLELHGDEFAKMVESVHMGVDELIPISDDALEVDTSFRKKKQISLNLNIEYDLMIKDIESWMHSHWEFIADKPYYNEPSYPNLIWKDIDQKLSNDYETSISREVIISLALKLFYRAIIEENPTLKEFENEDDQDVHYRKLEFYGHL